MSPKLKEFLTCHETKCFFGAMATTFFLWNISIVTLITGAIFFGLGFYIGKNFKNG